MGEGSHANVSWLTVGYSSPSVRHDLHSDDVTYDVTHSGVTISDVTNSDVIAAFPVSEVTHTDVTYDVTRGAGDEYRYEDGQYIHSDYDDDDADAEAGGHGSVHAADDTSCIGVRKRCLIDVSCAGLLADYRHYCRENKKQNECVAVERFN